MQVVVLSCGRSGTNMVLEILSGSPSLIPSDVVEDKQIFRDQVAYGRVGIPDGYLTKCDTVYIDSPLQIGKTLDAYPDLKIVWTVRHPKDWVLSKLYRGRAKSSNDSPSDDATLNGCVYDMNWMYTCYSYLKKNHGDRFIVVRMEDVINNLEYEATQMCISLNITYDDNMLNFISRMRHAGKRQRYKTLDNSQIDMWKRMYDIYDGWFKNKTEQIEVFEAVDYIVKEFGYDYE